MRFHLRAAAMLLPLAISAVVVSCGLDKLTGSNSSGIPSSLEGFAVTGDSVLIVGDSSSFTAVLPATLSSAAGVTVEWTSDNPTIASVGTDGRVTGRNPGITNINAVIAAPSLAEPAVRSTRVRVRYNSIGMLPMDSITGLTGSRRLWAFGNNRNGTRHSFIDPVYSLLGANDTTFIGFSTNASNTITNTCTPPANGFCRVVGKRVGQATVRAAFDGMTTTQVVRVSQVITRVVFQNPAVTISGIGTETTNPFSAFDAEDQPVANPLRFWSSSNPAVATVNATTGVIRAVSAGTARISLAIGDLVPGFDVRVVVPGAAHHLNIFLTGTTVAAGSRLGLGASVVDAAGNVVPTANHAITITQLSGNNGSLVGTLSANAVNGVATFPTVRLRLTGTNYVLRATTPGLSADQTAPLTVTPAPAAALAFTTQPSGGTQNTPLSPVRVSIVDSIGNIVTTATNQIQLVLATNPGGSTLQGGGFRAAVAGTATFSALELNNLGSGYTLSAQSDGFGNAVSSPFNIVGAPSRLAFLTQPSNAEAGLPVPAFQVQILDANGSLVGNATNAVTLSLDTGCGQTPGGTLTVNAVDGVATFNNVRLRTVCGVVRLNATSGNLSPRVSNNFAVSAGPAAQLVVITQPFTPQTAGFNQFISLQVRDSTGNQVTAPSVSVTVALGANPGGSTLSGTLTKNTSNGNVSFSDLQITKAANGYTLVASAPGLRSVTTSAFDVQPNNAQKLVFIVNPPSTVKSGVAMAPSVVVEVQDFFDNRVTGYSGTVDMTMRRQDFFGTSSTLSGTTSVSVSSGRATFSNLVANGVEPNPLVLNASVPGFALNSATSTTFTIVP